MRRARRPSCATALVLAIAACAPSTPPSEAPAPGTSPAAIGMARALAELVNVERTRAGLAPLRDEPRLARAAQIHADQMAEARRLAHDLPGATYPTLLDRFSAVRYEWQAIGENLAFAQTTAPAVVADWMRSAPHRDNLRNATFTETGIGHANDASGRTYFAQVFARPR
jgi:uncharacterized protein YkwD